MAPNVTLHFFRANDINGSPLLEITDEDEFFKGLTLKPDLYSVGGGEVTLARKVGFSLLTGAAVAPEAFVRVLVHAYSDTVYYTGFFLDKREQVVVDAEEDGGEEFHLGGPGPKFYLDRSILDIVDHLGEGWHLDLDNGLWRWKETAPAGQILTRILNEDAARDAPALPDLTKTFTGSLDSSGAAWATDIAEDGNYEIPIGRSYLQILFDLEDASGLYSTVNLGTVSAPVLELEGWNSYGDDVTATSFASGKVILREGVNVAGTELALEGRSLRKANRVIVGGKDATYEYVEAPGWSPGDYVKYAYIEYPFSSRAATLHQVGLRWLRRQEAADEELTVPIVPGANEGAGLYFPKPSGPLWLGNTITVDTAADGTTPTSIDLDNEDELVTGFEITLGPVGDTTNADAKAKSWDVKVKLNVERGGNDSHPDQTTIHVTDGSCCGPKACIPATPGSPAGATATFSRTWSYASNVNSDSADFPWMDNWNPSGSGALAGAHGWNGLSYDSVGQTPHVAVAAGQTVRLQGTVSSRSISLTQKRYTFRWYTNIGDVNAVLSEDHYTPASSNTVAADFDITVDVPASVAGLEIEADRQMRVDNVTLEVLTPIPGSEGDPGTCPVPTLGLPGEGTVGEPTGSYTSPNMVIEHFTVIGLDGNTYLHTAEQTEQAFTSSASDPTVNDDEADGYFPGWRWLDTTTNAIFMLVDSTEGAAVWQQIGTVTATGSSNHRLDPEWVLAPFTNPTGSGQITKAPETRISVFATSTYDAFPDAVLARRLIHQVHRRGSDHIATTDGVLVYSQLDPYTLEVVYTATIVNPTGDVRDPYIWYHQSGRLVVAYTESPVSSGVGRTLWTMFSDDLGLTWSTPSQITTHGFGSLPVVGHMGEFTDGTMFMGIYGKYGSDTEYSSAIIFSTDRGESWDNPVTIANGQTDGRMYGEPVIRLVSNGELHAFLRSDTTDHTYKVVGTDQGQTWGVITDVLVATGRPDWVEFRPGAYAMWARNDGTDFDSRYFTSWDRGDTWTAGAETDPAATQNQEYAAPVLLTEGYVVTLRGVEESSSDADIYGEFYFDGDGMDVLGHLRSSRLIVADHEIVTAGGSTGHVLTQQADGSFTPAPSAAAVDAATVSALGFVGSILISDSPSTPLVFADLIQNEAQDDLVYADL